MIICLGDLSNITSCNPVFFSVQKYPLLIDQGVLCVFLNLLRKVVSECFEIYPSCRDEFHVQPTSCFNYSYQKRVKTPLPALGQKCSSRVVNSIKCQQTNDLTNQRDLWRHQCKNCKRICQ